MAVGIRSDPTFTAAAPRALFAHSSVNGPSYDVFPDGRFIMIDPGQSGSPAAQISLVQNWFEELKRLVPTRDQ
jgi:hypothetical protein